MTELTQVLDACRVTKATIAAVEGYWDPLWAQLIGPLERRTQTQVTRRLLAELRKAGRPFKGLQAPAAGTRVWGFRQMFGAASGVPGGWDECLATVTVQLAAVGQPMLLLSRLVEGRNLHTHSGKAHSVIAEITRWRLSVRPPSAAKSTHIPCVRSPMQVYRPWTARFDERLPTDRDGARYPFCLPPGDRWARREEVAVRTVSSVPAWFDRAHRGWARPDIPGGKGYHWDVFFGDPDAAKIGVDQLNIVEFGANSDEGIAGELHHVPTKKAAKVSDIGWVCG